MPYIPQTDCEWPEYLAMPTPLSVPQYLIYTTWALDSQWGQGRGEENKHQHWKSEERLKKKTPTGTVFIYKNV